MEQLQQEFLSPDSTLVACERCSKCSNEISRMTQQILSLKQEKSELLKCVNSLTSDIDAAHSENAELENKIKLEKQRFSNLLLRHGKSQRQFCDRVAFVLRERGATESVIEEVLQDLRKERFASNSAIPSEANDSTHSLTFSPLSSTGNALPFRDDSEVPSTASLLPAALLSAGDNKQQQAQQPSVVVPKLSLESIPVVPPLLNVVGRMSTFGSNQSTESCEMGTSSPGSAGVSNPLGMKRVPTDNHNRSVGCPVNIDSYVSAGERNGHAYSALNSQLEDRKLMTYPDKGNIDALMGQAKASQSPRNGHAPDGINPSRIPRPGEHQRLPRLMSTASPGNAVHRSDNMLDVLTASMDRQILDGVGLEETEELGAEFVDFDFDGSDGDGVAVAEPAPYLPAGIASTPPVNSDDTASAAFPLDLSLLYSTGLTSLFDSPVSVELTTPPPAPGSRKLIHASSQSSALSSTKDSKSLKSRNTRTSKNIAGGNSTRGSPRGKKKRGGSPRSDRRGVMDRDETESVISSVSTHRSSRSKTATEAPVFRAQWLFPSLSATTAESGGTGTAASEDCDAGTPITAESLARFNRENERARRGWPPNDNNNHNNNRSKPTTAPRTAATWWNFLF